MPKRSGVLAASGLFVLWLAVVNILGVDRSESFFSNFERMEGWFTHLYLFVYLVILSSVFKTDKMWNWFLGVSVATANILSIAAAFGSELRTSVFLGNSTYVAIYVLFNLYFAALLAIRHYRMRVRDAFLKYSGFVYYALSILLFIYIIFRTQTRGTVLALVFSGIGFLVLSAISHWSNKTVRIISVSLLSLSVIGSILFWVNRDAQFIQDNPLLARVASISATEGTGQARLMNWGIALDGIKERPIFGWGQENYMYVFPKFYDPGMYAQEPWFDRTHNAFLDWAIQGGLVALALYISLYGFAIWTIYRSASLSKTEKNLLVSLFAGYAIHNLFVFDNYSSYLMFFTTLGLVVHHQHASNLSFTLSERAKLVATSVGIILVVFAGVHVIVKPYLVSKDLITALSTQEAEEVLSRYEKLIQTDTFGKFEVTTRFLSSIHGFARLNDPVITKRYLELANAAGQQSVDDTPESVRALEFYGSFLLQSGDYQKAVQMLERARALAPNRQNNLYALGFAYIRAGSLDKAVEVFKHAYDVAPQNEKARRYYGAMLILTGDSKKGNELVEGYDPTDQFFLSVFNQAKQHKEIISILQAQIAAQPTNYQLQVSLAIANLNAGNRGVAITLIQNVMKAVPGFKEQGEFIIKEIRAGRNPGL
jgi:O-antigen ligase/tetratricopeptide (TPR) repeat protein